MEWAARTAPSVGAARIRDTSVAGVKTAAGWGMTVNPSGISVLLLRSTR